MIQNSASLLVIYFFYGLAFFILGLAVAFEAQRSSSKLVFARAMLPLALYGLTHGAHEWLEMFILDAGLHGMAEVPLWVEGLRVSLLAISFAALIAFGVKLLYPSEQLLRSELYIGGGMLLFWFVSVLVMALVVRPGDAMHLTVRSWLLMADTWSRYSLGIPGGLISGYAVWRFARSLPEEQRRFRRLLRLAALTFLVYGAIGQVFVRETYLFPSHILNDALFEQWFGVPVQLLRAVLAIAFGLTLIPCLNMFELERQRALSRAEQAARDELARREALRREMLRYVVGAQEEERRRIARDLHDEIGQTLTALTLGMRNASRLAESDPLHLPDMMEKLHTLTTDAVSQMGHLVNDLRPSQLDHMGLAAALRTLIHGYRERFDLVVELSFEGERRRLPGEIELAVFRISQEALTNVVRHATAHEAEVRLNFSPDTVQLTISDAGRGFAPVESALGRNVGHWGLLGMRERAEQLDGTLIIESEPGRGTRVVASIPLPPDRTVSHNGRERPDQDSAG
ncbi:MAG: sensor histidine kinase [Anaerolineae bacterium]|nr:sensor histidine kinase [Anaerolineae bacterium]